MLLLAVTIHNIPEGLAVGVAIAGALYSSSNVSMAGAITLAIGIAIQNFPEGAIISMPLRAEGCKRGRAFLMGVLSGAVEPIASLVAILCAKFVVPIMPYVLSFAAGAMVYVVCEELIPEMHENESSKIGIIMLSIGFCIMLALDVAL